MPSIEAVPRQAPRRTLLSARRKTTRLDVPMAMVGALLVLCASVASADAHAAFAGSVELAADGGEESRIAMATTRGTADAGVARVRKHMRREEVVGSAHATSGEANTRGGSLHRGGESHHAEYELRHNRSLATLRSATRRHQRMGAAPDGEDSCHTICKEVPSGVKELEEPTSCVFVTQLPQNFCKEIGGPTNYGNQGDNEDGTWCDLKIGLPWCIDKWAYALYTGKFGCASLKVNCESSGNSSDYGVASGVCDSYQNYIQENVEVVPASEESFVPISPTTAEIIAAQGCVREACGLGVGC